MRARSGYWDAAAVEAPRVARLPLWRAHADAVNCAWVRAALGGCTHGRVLKTDAFDEAVGPGLIGDLCAASPCVVGIDLSLPALRAGRARYRHWALAAADVRSLPFGDGCFDVVVSISTLDHFESKDEIAGALRDLHRVLRPGGLLLLTLDNPDNPIVYLRNRLPFPVLHALGLLPYFVGATCGRRELRELLTRTGFEVDGLSALLHCPRALAIGCASLLESARWLPLRQAFLGSLMAFEVGARLPSRFLTGYFVAAVARREGGPASESPAC
jgi:SAM-dependent methyltransferase